MFEALWVPTGVTFDLPEDAAEEPEDSAQVALREREAAQEQVKVAAVGLLHGLGGIARGNHSLLNKIGETVELGGGDGGVCGFQSLRIEARAARTDGCGGPNELVKADGDGLAEVHGGLAWVGGDFYQHVAEGEVVAGQAVFFRAEDEGNAALGDGLSHGSAGGAAVEFA